MEKFRHGTLTVHTQLICILNSTRKISQLSSTVITWSAQVCVSLQHYSDHNYYYYRYYTRTPFATHPRARQVQSGMPGSLSGQAPLYLADDCRLVSDITRRSLRSADVSTCVVPPTRSGYGDRTFAAAGPRLWYSLPVQLHNPDITYGLFRRQLNGHLFREA